MRTTDFLGRERRPRPFLSPELMDDLQRIVPSLPGNGLEYRPCEVTLSSGVTDSYVYVVEVESWFRAWGIDPEDDKGKASLSVAEVVTIRESPFRLPPNFANEIYQGNEDGMGYFAFKVVLNDGQELECLTGNAIDLLEWPQGVTPGQVIRVVPHSTKAGPQSIVRSASFSWALYEQI
jgi:hypothetical protein